MLCSCRGRIRVYTTKGMWTHVSVTSASALRECALIVFGGRLHLYLMLSPLIGSPKTHFNIKRKQGPYGTHYTCNNSKNIQDICIRCVPIVRNVRYSGFISCLENSYIKSISHSTVAYN